MKYELLIFDWDGTLCDSTGRIVDSMQQAARESGLRAVPDSAVQNIIGLGLPEAIRTVWPEINEEQMSPMKEAYARYFLKDSLVGMGLFPGAQELLRQQQDFRRLAVATGKSRKGLDRVLSDLGVGRFFAVTRCADETLSKPDPLMLKQILAEIGVPVERALMVGDTSFDLDMANAIGMDSVAMSHGAHDEAVLLACRPKAICHSINELSEWIKQYG